MRRPQRCAHEETRRPLSACSFMCRQVQKERRRPLFPSSRIAVLWSVFLCKNSRASTVDTDVHLITVLRGRVVHVVSRSVKKLCQSLRVSVSHDRVQEICVCEYSACADDTPALYLASVLSDDLCDFIINSQKICICDHFAQRALCGEMIEPNHAFLTKSGYHGMFENYACSFLALRFVCPVVHLCPMQTVMPFPVHVRAACACTRICCSSNFVRRKYRIVVCISATWQKSSSSMLLCA